jgi:hypothetical protein
MSGMERASAQSQSRRPSFQGSLARVSFEGEMKTLIGTGNTKAFISASNTIMQKDSQQKGTMSRGYKDKESILSSS